MAGRVTKVRRAEETSDVQRYRGLLSSSVFGAAVVVAILFFGSHSASSRSRDLLGPGRLSPGHRAAALECDACHFGKNPAASCAGCHAGQTSTRAGHRALLSDGRLECTRCHVGHRSLTVSFDPSGSVIVDGPFGRQSVATDSLYRPATTTRVPLIRSEACKGCHHPESARDPLFGCLARSDARVELCFDEHEPAATASRSAAWEAAGRVARSPVPARLEERPAAPGRPFIALGLGLVAALLSFFGLRALGKRPVSSAASGPSFKRAQGKVRLPQVDPNTCLGCNACVDACPFDVLEVQRFVARVVRPDACCGLTLCEQKCPNGSLTMGQGQRVERRPLLSDELEVPQAPGVFLAGDLSGLSLIRNAVNQGAAVAHHVADRKKRDAARNLADESRYDLVIVGAGPAGLSASLEAKRRGLRALTLEQWDIAAGIRSFPRHKLVLDAGVDADERASLWLEECSKEQLLSKWLLIAKQQRLAIEAGRRVTAIEPTSSGYAVKARGDTGNVFEYRARYVLLAMGKRGTPRKLDTAVPDGWQERVHYALLDAQPFADKRILVIGLGDVAMEAAAALAEQPGARVTVAYRGTGFRRGKAKNQRRIQRLAADGRLELMLQTELRAFEAEDVILESAGQRARRQVDAVFVLIGSLLPWDFLRSVGVRSGVEA